MGWGGSALCVAEAAMRCTLRLATVVLVLCLPPLGGRPGQHQDHAAPTWTWMFDGNVFFGLNDQRRRFADYSAWESQNWFMVAADRQSPEGRLSANLMLSLEPFTVADGGSPQLFQTGESYQGVPLVNFQHQHDLLMGLGVTYTITTRPGVTYTVGADLVGFADARAHGLHASRVSAKQPPGAADPSLRGLDAHHAGCCEGGRWLWVPDPRGIGLSRRVARRGSRRHRAARPWTHGRPASAGGAGPGRRRSPADISNGRSGSSPYDATRITASISFDGAVRSRPLAMTLAWGENRQFNGFNGNVDGFLLEGDLRATTALAVYGRVEVAAKELFGLGLHPKEFVHPHWFSDVRAFTVGSVWDLPLQRIGRLGIGADVTLYIMGDDIQPFFDPSRSFHVFLRWRPQARSAARSLQAEFRCDPGPLRILKSSLDRDRPLQARVRLIVVVVVPAGARRVQVARRSALSGFKRPTELSSGQSPWAG